jgi:hypothetical protein
MCNYRRVPSAGLEPKLSFTGGLLFPGDGVFGAKNSLIWRHGVRAGWCNASRLRQGGQGVSAGSKQVSRW